MKSSSRIDALSIIDSVGSTPIRWAYCCGYVIALVCCNETFKQLFSHGWCRRFVYYGMGGRERERERET